MRISDWSSDVCSSDLVVERLVLEQRGEFRLGFSSLARLLLLQALGRDALVLLALGADRVGLGEVDVFALAGVAWMRPLRLPVRRRPRLRARLLLAVAGRLRGLRGRSEEHTSELQSLMRISYAVFCLKK